MAEHPFFTPAIAMTPSMFCVLPGLPTVRNISKRTPEPTWPRPSGKAEKTKARTKQRNKQNKEGDNQ
jgi:hypothetical protein